MRSLKNLLFILISTLLISCGEEGGGGGGGVTPTPEIYFPCFIVSTPGFVFFFYLVLLILTLMRFM